jgi:hypothetical protein
MHIMSPGKRAQTIGLRPFQERLPRAPALAEIRGPALALVSWYRLRKSGAVL